MNSEAWKNFLDMPVILKLCTVSTLAFPIFIAGSMFPDSSVRGFDRLVPVDAWWALGGGPSVVVVGLLMCASSWLMLKRAASTRLVYTIGWVLMIVSILIIGARFNLASEDLRVSIISNTVSMLILVAYLYLSRAVRSYFEAGNAAKNV